MTGSLAILLGINSSEPESRGAFIQLNGKLQVIPLENILEHWDILKERYNKHFRLILQWQNTQNIMQSVTIVLLLTLFILKILAANKQKHTNQTKKVCVRELTTGHWYERRWRVWSTNFVVVAMRGFPYTIETQTLSRVWFNRIQEIDLKRQ